VSKACASDLQRAERLLPLHMRPSRYPRRPIPAETGERPKPAHWR
jgi:hypothetical protein